MKPLLTYFIPAILLFSILAGCHDRNAALLTSADMGTARAFVSGTTNPYEPFDPNDRDSTAPFVTSARQYFGRFTIASVEFSGTATEQHQGFLARAVLYDRSAPVVRNGDTLGYRTISTGSVSIDSVILPAAPEEIASPDNHIDTIGIQYSYWRKDDSTSNYLAAQTRYIANHSYQWLIGGRASMPAFSETIGSPSNLRVTSPAPSAVIPTTSDLLFSWTGGSSSVVILVSLVRPNEPPKPLLQLQVPPDRHDVLVSSTILQALPQSYSRFLFTVQSETSKVVRVSGYADDIIFRVITSHSLLLYFNR